MTTTEPRTAAEYDAEIARLTRQRDEAAALERERLVPGRPGDEEFRRIHAAAGLPVRTPRGELFPDGASDRGGLMAPPPADPVANLQARADYHEGWAAVLRTAAGEIRRRASCGLTWPWPAAPGQGSFGPPPTPRTAGREAGPAVNLADVQALARRHLDAVRALAGERQRVRGGPADQQLGLTLDGTEKRLNELLALKLA